MSATKPLGKIEHVVVLMFENRSFDNMLGGLKPYGPDFDGVPPGWSNPVDPRNNKPTPNAQVQAFQAAPGYAARIMPFPDPLEDYADMSAQIDGGSMLGFLANYAKATGNDWTLARNIMQYYAPGPQGNIPVTSALASAFAVSDRYFGSGPVQTWPNRLFAHCGTPGAYTKSGQSYSYLNNPEYPSYPLMDGQLALPCVFELLDRALPSAPKAWKVYYDGEWPISTVVKYVYDRWKWSSEDGGNVFAFRSDKYPDFFSDVAQGTLPPYSFIEPRYQQDTLDPFKTIPPNSNHPGSASVASSQPPIDIQFGEQLLKEIYQALYDNPALFDKTLLIVTYDEHGGCFDHVTPPPAISPFASPVVNFDYTRYGPRVPAIFINPNIPSGSVLRPGAQPGKAAVFDHTSIIATLCAQFGLGGPLTARDGNAPLFENLITARTDPIPDPASLPELELNTAPYEGAATGEVNPDEINKNSLNYVMYAAVQEKRRRLKQP